MASIDITRTRGKTWRLTGRVRRGRIFRTLLTSNDQLDFRIADPVTDANVITRSTLLANGGGISAHDDGTYDILVDSASSLLTAGAYDYELIITEGDTTEVHPLVSGSFIVDDSHFP